LRVYTPALRWILGHKKTFLIAPVTILFVGLSIWLGIGKTLAPVGWAINLLAREQASPELKQAMYLKETNEVTRPLVEFDQLRWQRVRHADGSVHRRILWRRQDPKVGNAETASGVTVLKEHRI